jgi:hypothetical protein
MSSSINSLSGFLQSILTSSLQSAGSKTSTAATSTTGTASASDSTKLSPLAQLMSSLQQLQQSNPAEYQQVTKQISTNLQNAAQTAQSDGNTAAANQLNTLANDFTTASQTGQLPNIQDLAQAVTGSSSGSASSTSSATQTLTQILSAYQANGGQDQTLNPLSIINSTLESAGIGSSNS